jgi:HEAT repeat protein
VSADSAVSDAARERLFKTLNPALRVAAPESLDRDIAAILEAFNDEEPVRLQASALLGALATVRRDGNEALKRAIPVLLSQFTDQNQRVRENAIRSIAVLRPQVPREALTPLLSVVRDGDLVVASAAIYGVARFSGTSSVAVSELASLLSSDHPVQIRRAVIQSIGQERLDNPELITKLAEVLGDKDRDLVKTTIGALARIGPAAAVVSPALKSVADSEGDKELSSAAAGLLSRLEKSKEKR